MSRPFDRRREIALGFAAYALYLGVRHAVVRRGGRRRAVRNAARVARLEQEVGIAVEPWVQRHAIRRARMLPALSAGYAVFNVSLSVGWLAWLFVRQDPGFHRERRAALAAFAGGLPVFLLFPTAPPRALDHVEDILRLAGIDLDHPFLLRFYNPYAAMPSHHVAFAVVTGAGVAHRLGRRSGRIACRAYPAAVAYVVIATGNHFVLDVLAGAALGGVARRLAR